MTFNIDPNNIRLTSIGDPVPDKTCIRCNVGMVLAMAPCPDGRSGCLVMHWGLGCPKCGGNVYEKELPPSGDIPLPVDNDNIVRLTGLVVKALQSRMSAFYPSEFSTAALTVAARIAVETVLAGLIYEYGETGE